MAKVKTSKTNREFKGSWWIIVLWAIICFPVALVYYWAKLQTIETKE